MNIGLDIDGVIYPWHDSIFRYFREYKGFEGGTREFWDFFTTGLTPEEQEYYVSIPIMYLDTVPSDDVLTYVPKLAELGTLYYITSRPEHLKWATRKFFGIYQLPFKENIIFSSYKANYARLLGIDYFLDDLPHNIDSLLSTTDAYLLRQPHNWQAHDTYKSVGSIREFYEVINENSKVG